MIRGKKLYRSHDNRMIAGICAGIAEYFEIDPSLVRILWVLFSFAGGAGVLAYIAAYIIVPERPFLQKRCEKCGKMNVESASYCRSCGQKLETLDEV
jgi:phage shock protein PspC (stress-responsive transcriptional regulator)